MLGQTDDQFTCVAIFGETRVGIPLHLELLRLNKCLHYLYRSASTCFYIGEIDESASCIPSNLGAICRAIRRIEISAHFRGSWIRNTNDSFKENFVVGEG